MKAKIFLWLTVLSAVFAGISLWILDNMVCFGIAVALFIFNAEITLCMDKKYKDVIIELLDIF